MSVSTWFQRRRQKKRGRLLIVLSKTNRPMTAYELSKAARVGARITYAELDRWMANGSVVDSWGTETHPRRYYRLADR